MSDKKPIPYVNVKRSLKKLNTIISVSSPNNDKVQKMSKKSSGVDLTSQEMSMRSSGESLSSESDDQPEELPV